MWTLYRVTLTFVVDFVNFVVVRVELRFHILQQGVVLPRAFPEFVHDLQVLLGPSVTLIMRDDVVISVVFKCVLQITGHDVPSDSTVTQMIESRQLARECKWRSLNRGRSDRDPEMFRVAG